MVTYIGLPFDKWKMLPHINYFHLFNDCLVNILTYVERNNLTKNETYFFLDLDALNKLKMLWKQPGLDPTSIFTESLEYFVNITTVLPEKQELVYADQKDFSSLVRCLDRLLYLPKQLDTIVYKIRTGPRYILNDTEIIEAIRRNFGDKHKVIAVDFNGKTLKEQIDIMNGCKLFIGCHGAGLSNAYFMESGTNMLELFPESFYAACFLNICNRKNIKHFYLHGKSIREPPITLDTYMKEITSPQYNTSGFRSTIRDIQFTMDIKLIINKISEILR
jgi:hypothetical protein